MPASNESTRPSPSPPGREPLRLELAQVPGRSRLDGAWWPRSRDLAAELADLAAHFPPEHGRVVRASVSAADWDTPPARVAVAGGWVEVGPSPRDDTHLVRLTLSDESVLEVLVVPPGLTSDQGEEALLAGATAGNAHAAADVLAEVTNSPDVDAGDHWSYQGEAWPGASAVPPASARGRVAGS